MLRGARDRWRGLCELQAVGAGAKSAGNRWRRCAGWQRRRRASSGAMLGRGGAGRARRRMARSCARCWERGVGPGACACSRGMACSGRRVTRGNRWVTCHMKFDEMHLICRRSSRPFLPISPTTKFSGASLGSSLLEHYSYLMTYSARIYLLAWSPATAVEY